MRSEIKIVAVIASFLIVSIIYSITYAPSLEIHPNGIGFNSMLDLINENATITAIGSYMINGWDNYLDVLRETTLATIVACRYSD